MFGLFKTKSIELEDKERIALIKMLKPRIDDLSKDIDPQAIINKLQKDKRVDMLRELENTLRDNLSDRARAEMSTLDKNIEDFAVKQANENKERYDVLMGILAKIEDTYGH